MRAITEFEQFLKNRGVNIPCSSCKGYGNRWYSSGATWRGGIGTTSCVRDICDECWGTGDKDHIGVDIRKLEKQRANWEKDQCLSWLQDQLGVNLGKTKNRIQDLVNFCSKQENRRKVPEGEDPFWWNSSWHMLSKCLEKLIKD